MFTKLDTELSKQLKILEELSENIKFEYICQFHIKDKIDEIPWKNLEHQGLYLIEIETQNRDFTFGKWIKEFQNKWEVEEYRGMSTPSMKKKRIKAQQHKSEKWVPIYIGKSKNISKRIYEHIFLPLEKKTSALKLYSRMNLRDENFRLKKIRVDVENYDTIVPKMEKIFREKINPLIGRQ